MAVSMQMTLQTIHNLVSGLTQMKNEVGQHRQSKDTSSSNDKFVQVMQVKLNDLNLRAILNMLCQSFIAQVSPNVDSLMKMGNMIEEELRSLLIYYGEDPDSPDAPKPEEFFGLVASFSSTLQVILTPHNSNIHALNMMTLEMCIRSPGCRQEEAYF